MRGVPSRALGSRPTLRDRLSTRHIAESRVNAWKNANSSRLFGPSRGGRSDNRRAKPRAGYSNVSLSTRKFVPSRGGYRSGRSDRTGNLQTLPVGGYHGERSDRTGRLPVKSSVSGNGNRDPTRIDKSRLVRLEQRNVANQQQQGSVNRGPSGYKKPVVRNNQKYNNRQEQRFNHPPRTSETSGRYGLPHSTKDSLFQGPEKSRSYREEDLKKFKVDIRNSRSPEHKTGSSKELYDRAELRKFKIDIKGETYDNVQARRDEDVYLDSHGVPYDKQELKKVEIQIHRLDVEKVRDVNSKSLKRSLEVDKFYVPRYKDVKLLNSRNTFSSPRHQEKMDLDQVKVNIEREVAHPSDAPVRRDFEADKFEMFRRPDTSPPRDNRKVSLDKRNQPRDRRDNFDLPPKYHPWADEGARPVFDSKNVTPNVVRLADIFPSESDKLNKSHQGHPQKYPASSQPPRSRSYERNRDYIDHKRYPSSTSDYHKADHTLSDFRSRPLSPIPAQEKHRPSLERRDQGLYDGYKTSSDRSLRRSRSPLLRHAPSSPRQRPALSPSRLRPPSPKRRALSPPLSVEDKYRSHERSAPYEDRYRSEPDKRVPNEDKYRSGYGKASYDAKYRSELDSPAPFDNKYRAGQEKLPYEDKYQSTNDKPAHIVKYGSGHDKSIPFEDKYRTGHNKPATGDKYRSGYDKPSPFGDKYRSSHDRPAPFGDKYRSSHDRPAPFGDKYRSSHDRPTPFGDKYRSSDDRPAPFNDKYRSSQARPAPFGDKYRSPDDRPAPFGDNYRSSQDRRGPNEDKFRTGQDKSTSYEYKCRNENRRVGSSSNPTDKYDTSRREYESYHSGGSHSPSGGRGERRRGGEHRDTSSPPSSRNAFSTDAPRGREYYSNGSAGGDGRVDGGGGLMQMVPVIPHPHVFSPFMRPLPPGPPHMFRPRGPFLPFPIFVSLPPRPFRFRRTPPRRHEKSE